MIRTRKFSRLFSGSRCSRQLCVVRSTTSPLLLGPQRRRLVSPAMAPFSTSSTDWKDWFRPGPRHGCPWDTNPVTAWLQPLDDEALDISTRHAVQLLQEFYKTGGRPRTMDIITTQRCNALLQKLVDYSMSTSSLQDTGARHRADAILQAMQLFDETRLARAHSQSPPPPRIEYLFPHPNIQTFNLVLRVFANSPSTTRAVPDRALELCQALQHWHQVLADNDSSYQPITAFHYNCVLNAWRLCRESWQTPAHAARVFLEEMTPTTRDSSSFVIMFKICAQAQYPQQETVPPAVKEQQQAKELGGLVAIKIWQDVVADDESLELKSHVYTHFCQAIRDLALDHPLRAEYFRLAFQRAVRHGKVNAYLINEFMVHCKSPKIYNEFLGEVRRRTDTTGMSPTQAAKAYFRVIPESWRRYADL